MKNKSANVGYKKSLYEKFNLLILDLIWLFYRLTGFKKVDTSKKIILCYHSIGEDGWRFSTRVKTFKEHFDYLTKNYKLVSLSKLLEDNEGGINLAFDDGYRNLITNVFPILKEAGVSASLFVIGERKKANRSELGNNLPLLNDEELLKLKKNNWEIGFHTETHANLNELTDERLNEEINLAKSKLEKNLGLKLDFFAYPRGHYSTRIEKYVAKAKFKSAFTVDGGFLNLTANKYYLARVPMEGEIKTHQFAALLSPLGMLTAKVLIRLLKVKAKIVSALTN